VKLLCLALSLQAVPTYVGLVDFLVKLIEKSQQKILPKKSLHLSGGEGIWWWNDKTTKILDKEMLLLPYSENSRRTRLKCDHRYVYLRRSQEERLYLMHPLFQITNVLAFSNTLFFWSFQSLYRRHWSYLGWVMHSPTVWFLTWFSLNHLALVF